jgi:hypothetical protein
MEEASIRKKTSRAHPQVTFQPMFSQAFCCETVEHTAKLKDFYSKHLHTYYPDSTFNIMLYDSMSLQMCMSPCLLQSILSFKVNFIYLHPLHFPLQHVLAYISFTNYCSVFAYISYETNVNGEWYLPKVLAWPLTNAYACVT